MPRKSIAALPAIAANLSIPLSGRTMRVAFARPVTGVLWVEVTAGGTGYTHAAAVSFTGGGGTGAAGVMLCRSGVVVAVAMTDPGTGYTSAPTPVFTAGSGTGAAGTAYLADSVADMAAAHTTHCVWHYTDNTPAGVAFKASVAAAGISLQGTLSGQVFYDLGNTQYLNTVCLAMNGQPVPVGFSLKQSKAFGASRRSAYLDYQQANATAALADGITAVHFDDPSSDLIAMRSVDPAYSGGVFDSETLAAFGTPNLVALIAAQGVTQDSYNWTAVQANQGWVTTASNWNTSWTSWTQFNAFYASLKEGIRTFHSTLRATRFGSLPYTLNAYDPFPLENSSAWILPSCDGALFETDSETYSGANIGNAERYTRLWVNIKTCEGAGVMCIPHLQPLRNDSVNVASRAQRLLVLLQQYALSYALGARPTYPYDIYCYPFDSTRQNERWFAKTNDGFRVMAQMVRDYPELFDNTVVRQAMLLVYDTDVNSSQTPETIMLQGGYCLRNGVPAVLYPVGQGYTRNAALEAGARRIVNCSGTLTGLIPGAVEFASFNVLAFQQFSAARLAGTFTDCFAIPRLRDDRYIAHIVNFDGGTKTDLVLTVPWWALSSYKRPSVYFHKPAGGRVRLAAVTASDSGLRIAIPSMSEWGIVSVELT